MAKDEIVDAEGDAGPTTDSLATGIVIFTTIALLGAFFLIKYAHGVNYETGMFAP